MPELPEVETVRRELEPWLAGREILRASLVDAEPGPKYAGLERAAGQRIVGVRRRGKFLLLPLEAGGERRDELVIHLGMTGVVSAEPPPAHLRVRLDLDGSTLYFRDTRRFGRFLLVPAGDYRDLPTLNRMGPEPLGDEFTPDAFARELARSATPVKTYLLSQRPVAGVGNIYADEALWRAGVHPRTPAREVPAARVGPLRDAIRAVLAESIAAMGTTLADYRTVGGEQGGFGEHLDAYGREEQPCRRCGTPIAKTTLGGRGTHYCPRCQPEGPARETGSPRRGAQSPARG